jgi:hypothetical protein
LIVEERLMNISYVRRSLKAASTVAFGLLLLSTGCAMRVTGTVRDAATGTAIGGAVLTAADGRNRLSTTDPSGRYAVKTDWRPTNLMVSAPGFVTTTVAVPDTNRYPVINVDLQRFVPVAAAPIVSRLDGGSVRSGGTGSYVDTPTAPRLQELQALYDRGLISDDEYRRTRSQILRGL